MNNLALTMLLDSGLLFGATMHCKLSMNANNYFSTRENKTISLHHVKFALQKNEPELERNSYHYVQELIGVSTASV